MTDKPEGTKSAPELGGGPDFIAAESFDGVKTGYGFKKGDQGMGYYKDAPDAEQKKAPRHDEVERTRAMLAKMGAGADGNGTPDPKSKLGGLMAKKNWKAKWKVAAKVIIATKQFQKPSGKYLFPAGGKFNMSNPKNEIDWQVHRAKDLPGPAKYGAPKLEGPTGGKFNMSKPKGEIEWQVHRTQGMPAPGAYSPKTALPAGGGFNLAKPKTELDWVIHRAKESPGPASYYTDLCPYQVGPTFKSRMDRHKGAGGKQMSQDPGKARGGGGFLKKGQGSGGKAPSAGGGRSGTLSSSGQSGVRSLQRQMRSLQAENTALKSQLASTK